MEILQHVFIKILNPMYGVTKYIPEKVRDVVISICFGAIFLKMIERLCSASYTFTYQTIIGCMFLLMIIIMSMKGKLEVLKWNRLLSIAWLICSVLMFLIGFIHPVGNGFRALSLTMMVGFPCLYFVWGNRGDYNKLFRLMSYGFAVVGTAYLAYCLIFVRFNDLNNMEGGRYLGGTRNVNFCAMICIVIVMAALYLSVSKVKLRPICLLVGGVANFFILMTVSRTAMLSVSIIIGMFVVFEIKECIVCKCVPARKILNVVAVMLVFSTSTIAGDMVQHYQGDTASLVLDNQLRNHENFIAQNEDAYINSDSMDIVSQRLDTEGKDLDAFSSGRITIWKAYIEELSWLGHDSRKRLYIEEQGMRHWAHNTVLEI